MAISRAQQLKELLPGLNGLFGMVYKTYDEEHKAIFEIESSERSFEEEVKLSGFDQAPVKREGQAIAYDNAQEHYTARYSHETIAMGFSITEEAMEDNLYDSQSMRYTKALARAMAYTKQVKGANILNNGFTTFLSGDGQPLLDTAHPLISGDTNANEPSVAADLNETSLEDAVINISKFTDERGLLIAARPRRIIVPTDLQFVITRLLETEFRTGTADNDISAIVNNGVIPEGYSINNYLTDVDAWFIITDCPDGLKMFQRVKLATSMDGDFDTGNVRYKARERFSFGVSDPLGVYGSPGA